MAMDPEFFTPRHAEPLAHEPGLDLARQALLAAVDVALVPDDQRVEAAGPALRMLRALCFEASPGELIGLTFPLGREALVQCLAAPCRIWLPYAAELGVGNERLLVLGLPTAACRDILDRLG
jgi:hypothetical protein